MKNIRKPEKSGKNCKIRKFFEKSGKFRTPEKIPKSGIFPGNPEDLATLTGS